MAKKSKKGKKSNNKRAGYKPGSFRFTTENTPLPQGFLGQNKELISKIAEENNTSYQSIITTFDSNPVVSIRINTSKVKTEDQRKELLSYLEKLGCEIIEVPWCEDGYYLSNRIDFTADPLHHAGLYYVQEPASMIIGQHTKDLSLHDSIWLDMAAAPGGKTTHIASSVSYDSVVVANEYDKKRILALKDNVLRMGCDNVIITNNDGRDFGELSSYFGFTLLDAPCSGEGMFRKDIKSRVEWSLEKVKENQKLQKELLSAANNCTSEKIIYSTCTFNQEENERHFDDELSAVYNISKASNPIQKGLRFIPGITESEGFFVKEIELSKEKDGGSNQKAEKNDNPIKKIDITLPFINKDKIDKLGLLYIELNDIIYLVNDKRLSTANELISAGIRVEHMGVAVAHSQGSIYIPHHHLAMSNLLNTIADYELIEVPHDMALKYLKGESINLEANKGYVVLTYKDHPLGFGKSIGNRINNLYPKHLRIKKKI